MQKPLITPKNKEEELILKFYFSLGKGDYNSCFSKHDFTNYQRFVLLYYYIKENKSLREFVNWLKTNSKLPKTLQLKKIPSKSTLNSWFKMFNLDLLKQKFSQFFKPKNAFLAVDGTGLDTNFRSSYYEKRAKLKPSHDYNKLDIIIDIINRTIIGYEFNFNKKHDIRVLRESLLKYLNFKDRQYWLFADKGYYSYILYYILKSRNINFVVPPKNYGSKFKHNNILRKQFHKCYYEYGDCYNLRSIVESVFSALKEKNLKF